MAGSKTADSASERPKSAQEVVRLVEEWLKVEGNIQSLKAIYAETDRKVRDISEYSRSVSGEPLRVKSARARVDGP